MYGKQKLPHVVLLKLPAQPESAAILKKIDEQSQSRNANRERHVSQDKQDDRLFTNDLVDFVDSRFENAQWIHDCSLAQAGNSLSDEENLSHLRCEIFGFVFQSGFHVTADFFKQNKQ